VRVYPEITGAQRDLDHMRAARRYTGSSELLFTSSITA
jgi:hypothetical protein